MSQAGADETQRQEQRPLRRVMIVFGEIGTHWFHKLVSAALGKPPIDQGLRNPETLVDILEWAGQERLLQEGFLYDRHGKILDPVRYPDLRIVLLHRHPLDQFVADSWHQMGVTRSKSLPNPEVSVDENMRGLLLGNFDATLDTPYEEVFKADLRRKVIDWMETGRCLLLRCEDIEENAEAELIRCLNHLEIRFDPAEIKSLVEQYRPAPPVPAAGSEGQTSNATAVDHGQPGAWRSIFKPQDIHVLKSRFGGIIQRLGYTIERFDQKPLHRILISYGRSGTHWLKYMISAAMDRPPVEAGVWELDTLAAILKGSGRRRLVYEHFRFDLHGDIFDPAKDPDVRLVLLHRHPLDQFISATWHRVMITGELTDFDPETPPSEIARRLLLGEYDERLGYSYTDAHLDTHKRGVIDWIESGRCLQVKFEDLVERTEEQLVRCLEHLEIRYDKSILPSIVEKNKFEKLSGGRKPGEMDGKHHYRKGAPGEWRSVFKPEDLPILQEKYGDAFARQGYPI